MSVDCAVVQTAGALSLLIDADAHNSSSVFRYLEDADCLLCDGGGCAWPSGAQSRVLLKLNLPLPPGAREELNFRLDLGSCPNPPDGLHLAVLALNGFPAGPPDSP